MRAAPLSWTQALRSVFPSPTSAFSAAPDQSLLDAALGASLNLPHSCKGGNCGSCRARLLQGEIHYPNGPPLGTVRGRGRRRTRPAVPGARARRSDASRRSRSARPSRSRSNGCRPHRAHRAPCRTMSWVFICGCPPRKSSVSRPDSTSTSCCRAGGGAVFRSPRRRTTRDCWNCTCAGSTGGEFTEPLFDDGGSAVRCSRSKGPLGQFCYRETGHRRRCCWSAAARASRPCSASCGMWSRPAAGATCGCTGACAASAICTRTRARRAARRARLRAGAVRAFADWQRPARLRARGRPRRYRRDLDRYDVYAAGPPAMIARGAARIRAARS